MSSSYQICTRCIMDTSVPDIYFDENGICNLCKQYKERIKRELHYDSEGQKKLYALIDEIKQHGKGQEYDCLIGISGGVDSTYVAYLVKKKYGLRPLALHLDNGWDSELAISNVEQVLKQLEIDLYTIVLDWEEFKDLQISFLRSSIANAEIPTDQAILAVLFKTAWKRNIKYIITGYNLVTEGILPSSWMYDSKDLRLLHAIQNQFGTVKLNTYPELSMFGFAYCILAKRIQSIPILNYVPYVKAEAKQFLIKELGWRDYGAKHYESIFTRFFQGYLLPRKFNIDKRRAHLSTLIMSEQITRQQALAEMERPAMTSEQEEEDGEYVMKKLGLSLEEFSQILAIPPKPVSNYANNANLVRRFDFAVQIVRRMALRDA